jgi:hypothetical protein
VMVKKPWYIKKNRFGPPIPFRMSKNPGRAALLFFVRKKNRSSRTRHTLPPEEEGNPAGAAVAAPRSPICTPPLLLPGWVMPLPYSFRGGARSRTVKSSAQCPARGCWYRRPRRRTVACSATNSVKEPKRIVKGPNPPFHESCPHRVRLRFSERISRRGRRRMDPPSHAREELDPFFRKEFLGGGRKYGDGRHLQPVLPSFLSPCFLCVGTAPTAQGKDICAQAETMVMTSQPLAIASSISRQRHRFTA